MFGQFFLTDLPLATLDKLHHHHSPSSSPGAAHHAERRGGFTLSVAGVHDDERIGANQCLGNFWCFTLSLTHDVLSGSSVAGRRLVRRPRFEVFVRVCRNGSPTRL